MSKYYLLVVGLVLAVVGGLAKQAGYPLATFIQIAGGVFIAIFAGFYIFKRDRK